MKLVTCISKMSMREMIILHCRVVYQSNVLLGQWTDYGFLWGGGEGGRGGLNPRELKKNKKKHF